MLVYSCLARVLLNVSFRPPIATRYFTFHKDREQDRVSCYKFRENPTAFSLPFGTQGNYTRGARYIFTNGKEQERSVNRSAYYFRHDR